MRATSRGHRDARARVHSRPMRWLWWMTSLALLGCSPLGADGSHDEPLPGIEAGPAVRTGADTALALLGELSVREHGPRDGYGREQFGPPWADADRNGCDTRDDILLRDLVDTKTKPGGRACVVVSGTLEDPYTGRKIRFDRGGASEVDIDHVVALDNAWVTGAATLPFRQRIALANDPLNLIAAEARANRSKGASDAARWLPPKSSRTSAPGPRRTSNGWSSCERASPGGRLLRIGPGRRSDVRRLGAGDRPCNGRPGHRPAAARRHRRLRAMRPQPRPSPFVLVVEKEGDK